MAGSTVPLNFDQIPLRRHHRKGKMQSVGKGEKNCLEKCSTNKIFHFSDVGILLLLTFYTLFGAGILYIIEEPNEISVVRRVELKFEIKAKNISYSIRSNCLSGLLNASECESFIVHLLNDNYFPASARVKKWTFVGAILFASTTYSTIGYGHIAPKTVAGQIFTIFYCIFGIPLFFIVLARIGNKFGRLLYFIWTSLRHRLCGYAAIENEYMREMAVKQRDFPISVALVMTLSWILICSALFQLYEQNWSYFKAFYFSFITLTTIGLGDIVPADHQTMAIFWVFIILGLSLISMCISMIQIKLEVLYDRMLIKVQEIYEDAMLQEDDGAMVAGNTVDIMHKIGSQEKRWMMALLGHQRRQHLMEEWRKKSEMKLKSTQTDPIEFEQPEFADDNDVVSRELLQLSNRPFMEVARNRSLTRNKHEFNDIIQNVQLILEDCRDILQNKHSTADICEP